ncbi:hypothetical protein ACH5RR_007480 [Cinchona calisaya]|uniref:Disease resistance protein At1g50180 n=1 Tax=Cinchona calisaya TaxID=153742 RepID=A0ABD3ASF0_9GENT
MAEAAVSLAVKTISNLLIDEAKFLHGVSDQVKQLQLELSQMRAFLKDADMRQHDEETVKEWISQARDLAYQAEDLIESYAFKVASRRGKGIKNIFKRSVGILKECYVSHNIGKEIQTLKSKISDLTKTFHDHGISRMMEREGGTSLLEQQLRRTYSHVIEDDFVGLKDDVELIVEKLVMEDEIHRHLRVVSISGMGGLGKTTLAQKVYNHPTVKRYFDGYTWICVSQKWQKKDMLQQILSRLTQKKREEIKELMDEELVRQLFQILESKKYLLVLDDIWSIDAWDCIKQAFPVKKDGSKILLTTRSKDVAAQIDPYGFHYQPRLLSNDESWELLKMKALKEICERENEEIQKLEKLGKEMVKDCGGLPLAVIVIGGILATKNGLKEWEDVQKNIKAYLGRGNNLIEEQGNVHKILALSYDDLPHKLKPCFLYLCKFDEDSDIDVEKLYLFWIAEGMVSMKDCIGDETMMDVAERYLGELVQRSMVQGNAPEIPTLFRYFSSCRLHDLMRDLSLRKAEEESFLLSVSYDDEKGNDSSSILQQVYRLVIDLSGQSVPKYDAPLEKRVIRRLRLLGLLVYGRFPQTMISQLNQFKMLRVLAITGFSFLNEDDLSRKVVFNLLVDQLKLQKAISKLIHLRYLSLWDSTLVCLPSSIANLQHLQTLDLRGTEVFRIPNVLWKMRQLRYLYLPENYMSDNYLFVKFRTFYKLRLDGLDKLEILENCCIPICHAKDISKLKNLRSFSAEVFVELEDPTEIIQYISNLNHLRRTSLTIECYGDSAAAATEKLSSAIGKCFSCCNLQGLRIVGPIGNLPKYEAHFCPALTELSLHRSDIKEDPMKTLEMLPNLHKLNLHHLSFVGKEMRCTVSHFPQLRYLLLWELPNLEKWWVDEGAMPNLSNLTIFNCNKLEMIPIGLKSITTLKELNILDMPKEFTDRIKVVDGREGADFHIVSHIPSISI